MSRVPRQSLRVALSGLRNQCAVQQTCSSSQVLLLVVPIFSPNNNNNNNNNNINIIIIIRAQLTEGEVSLKIEERRRDAAHGIRGALPRQRETWKTALVLLYTSWAAFDDALVLVLALGRDEEEEEEEEEEGNARPHSSS